MQESEVVRVAIVDDHPVYRLGLKTIIEQSSKYSIVCEGEDWQGISEQLLQGRFDVIFLDLMLQNENSIDYIERIKSINESIKIVIISGNSNIDLIVKAFIKGADGYLSKANSYNKVIESMESVLGDTPYFDGKTTIKLINKLIAEQKSKEKLLELSQKLSARELEILKSLVSGLNVLEISSKLFISPKTVENHRTSIMRKLAINNSIQLVKFAARSGLIDPNTFFDN